MTHEHDMHNPWILHTDNQSIFTSEEFVAFADPHNIELSRSSPQAHENQVSERVNRTLQDILRLLMTIELKNKIPIKFIT
jgi:transposase InsO family protein